MSLRTHLKKYSLFAVVSLIMVLVLLLIPVSVSADAEETNSYAVGPKYISMLDSFFAGNGTAYGENGTEITETIYSSYLDAYKNSDYNTIMEGLKTDGVTRIKTRELTDSKERQTRTKSYTEYDAVLMTHSGYPFDGKSWYFLVEATGKLYYDDSTVEITSSSSPSINCSFEDLGTAFEGSYSYTVTTPRISADKSYISFTVNATQTITYDFGDDAPMIGTLDIYYSTSNFEAGL